MSRVSLVMSCDFPEVGAGEVRVYNKKSPSMPSMSKASMSNSSAMISLSRSSSSFFKNLCVFVRTSFFTFFGAMRRLRLSWNFSMRRRRASGEYAPTLILADGIVDPLVAATDFLGVVRMTTAPLPFGVALAPAGHDVILTILAPGGGAVNARTSCGVPLMFAMTCTARPFFAAPAAVAPGRGTDPTVTSRATPGPSCSAPGADCGMVPRPLRPGVVTTLRYCRGLGVALALGLDFFCGALGCTATRRTSSPFGSAGRNSRPAPVLSRGAPCVTEPRRWRTVLGLPKSIEPREPLRRRIRVFTALSSEPIPSRPPSWSRKSSKAAGLKKPPGMLSMASGKGSSMLIPRCCAMARLFLRLGGLEPPRKSSASSMPSLPDIDGRIAAVFAAWPPAPSSSIKARFAPAGVPRPTFRSSRSSPSKRSSDGRRLSAPDSSSTPSFLSSPSS
mmetsp:Transcript_16835/g.51772  ORF Transcript_16835/g.51772 Transcript_16835/m.51772 type:complete len:446 (+) Transcript_16835:1097-2434(+)